VIRRLFVRRRPADPDLEQAKRNTAQSRARAQRDLTAATARRDEAAPLTSALRRHNAANGYNRWLEEQVLRGGR
jgi:hypothetical protein